MTKDNLKHTIATQVFCLCRDNNIQCREIFSDMLEINYKLKHKKRIFVRVFYADYQDQYWASINTVNNSYGVSGKFNTIADTIFLAIKKQNLNLFYKGANR